MSRWFREGCMGALLVAALCFGAGQLEAAPPALVIAHFAVGGGINLELIMSNQGAEEDRGTIYFYDGEGAALSVLINGRNRSTLPYTLVSGGTLKLNPTSSGFLQTGYIVVRSQKSDSHLIGSVVYELAGSEVSVSNSPLTTRSEAIVELAPSGSTGVAFVNPGSESGRIYLMLINDSGAVVRQEHIDLDPGEKKAVFLTELFGNLGSFSLGTLHAWSNEDFAWTILRQKSTGSLATLTTTSVATTPAPSRFGVVTVQPEFFMDGRGRNIDSLAFWEAPNPTESLLFVTAKENSLVEVWKYPFERNERSPIAGYFENGKVNGVVVDQRRDRLWITVAEPVSKIVVLSLPNLHLVREIRGMNLKSEPNLGRLDNPDGSTWIYATGDDHVFVFDADTFARLDDFDPHLAEIETIAADPFSRIVYVPDEIEQKGVFAYHPDGRELDRCDPVGLCTSRFGTNAFRFDAEGITLYSCPSDGSSDNGQGFIIVSDQIGAGNEYEFFDRRTWKHLGSLMIEGVGNTDGIASTQQSSPAFPMGAFAAVDDDTSVAIVGWDTILPAIGFSCSD